MNSDMFITQTKCYDLFFLGKNAMSDVDVDEPEAMDDSAEDPVEPGDEEGDENDNPNRQQNPECNDAPEPTDEDAESSEKAERLHKFPLGRIKNIMKQG